MEPLTEKQQKVLKYIENRLEKNDPPSQREIARHFHLAQNAVFQLITYLRKKGYLEAYEVTRDDQVRVLKTKDAAVKFESQILGKAKIEYFID